jgi:hypothetical protein
MGLVHPVQMMAEVGSIRVAVGCERILAGASNVDTAMVGRPAKTISGSSILMDGRGWKVAGRDPGSMMDGTLIVGGSIIIGGGGVGSMMLGGSTVVGMEGGSTIVGTEGSTIEGTTIEGTVNLGLTGESCLTGEFDLDRFILPISPDKSPSLPSLISVTVDGNLLPVFFSYPSPDRTTGAAPIPLGIPLSRLLDATTTTGGLGKGRLLGELNPIPLSSDLTDDIVSDRSSDSTGVLGVEGPASGGAVWVRIGEGSGLAEDGRKGGSGADLDGDEGAGDVDAGRESVRRGGSISRLDGRCCTTWLARIGEYPTDCALACSFALFLS